MAVCVGDGEVAAFETSEVLETSEVWAGAAQADTMKIKSKKYYFSYLLSSKIVTSVVEFRKGVCLCGEKSTSICCWDWESLI